MNYLMAKTGGRNAAICRVLSQEAAIYTIPDLNDTLAYMDDYKLEEGQWFVLENFSAKDYFPDFLGGQFDATAYGVLPRGEYPRLKYLFAVQVDGNFCFQKITSTKVLQKRLVTFSLDEAPSVLDAGYCIVLNNEPDAIYSAADDKLYFRDLSSITTIFRGIEELYREATDEETQNFMDLPIIQAAEDYTLDKIKTANRRRIKAAMEKYNAFTPEQKRAVPSYLREYCPALPFDEAGEAFRVSNEKELTELLNGLNQRYYTTAIDGEKRLANSVTRLQ